MAQLTDDCFAFGGPLLAIDDVERLIDERVTPVAETETVALKDARGRVLAADVIAPIDLPPFDNSAVDGYAVRHADLGAKGETTLAIVDRLTAGRAAAHAIGAGRGDPHLHRRADAAGRRHGVHAGGRARGRRRRDRAAGPEARREHARLRARMCRKARSRCAPAAVCSRRI